MTDAEKEAYVEMHFLEEAISSIESHGRYWNASISRLLTGTLARKLADAGYSVIVREVPPQWEHVFYLSKDASQKNDKVIDSIAKKRYELMESERSKSELPV
ncbi:hypothetical protein [Permianibacter aggregans]|uniref:Uncharacterized protein n=1 Tax=Permianibacter aggregans TaxID=1510150 RepID=A0A4R6ULA1_9GAMM|nr:hypothetical protein [Permianibacter aggregans]QGX40163.1 hypothetical protein E2H98_10970 [Permianibacter aggregans]TDQ47412.1 hypothetical protein EV696_1104 [Permianibacter aggregans]